jgi:hypothetical protein
MPSSSRTIQKADAFPLPSEPDREAAEMTMLHMQFDDPWVLPEVLHMNICDLSSSDQCGGNNADSGSACEDAALAQAELLQLQP